MRELLRRGNHYMFILPVLGCLVATVVGWTKWSEEPNQTGVLSRFSFVGMCLSCATVFGLLAFAIYAEAFGVIFSAHYDLLVTIYKLFAPLCVLGFLFGLVGVWRRSPLRWYAPACAFFTAVSLAGRCRDD